ncbi:MAG: hypothetical protein ACI37O_00155 [Candidatus Avelusimicrobium sp.]|uniref:hypothetical protein n=1 Tax=Candidatus Avelusimicrobium sp. TaxID=3048833 RepID=UPI003F0AB310
MDNFMTDEEYKQLRAELNIYNDSNEEMQDVFADFTAACFMKLKEWDSATIKSQFAQFRKQAQNKMMEEEKLFEPWDVVEPQSDCAYSTEERSNRKDSKEKMLADTCKDNISPAEQFEQQNDEKKCERVTNVLNEICEKLDEKSKNRLFVLCLKFDNTIKSLATKSPSDWPPSLKEKFNKKYPANLNSYLYGKERSAEEKYQTAHNVRPSYEIKKRFLRTELEPATAFFDVLQKYFLEKAKNKKKELDYSGWEKKQELYARCYERAQFTSRPSRDAQTLLARFKPFFDADGAWQNAEKAFKYISITKELNEEGEKAWTYRDKTIKPALNLKPCRPEYLELVQLKVLAEYAKQYQLDFHLTEKQCDIVETFNAHYYICKACRNAAKRFEDALRYRLNQFAGKISWQGRVYPKHIYTEEGLLQTQKQDRLAYYEEMARQFASPLNTYFFQTACKLAGKSVGAVMKNQPVATPRIAEDKDYVLSVRCICGIESRYPLNHWRVVSFGRLQSDGMQAATINVCADDDKHISRNMFELKYDAEENDWFLSAGGDAPKKRSQNGTQIGYITFSKLRNVLDAQIAKTPAGSKVQCQQIWAREFTRLGDKRVPLGEVAGIGLVWLAERKPLLFHGETKTGVDHPLLGKLPFGWYIDVFSRAPQQAINSFVDKTVSDGADQQKEIGSVPRPDNPTIIG